MQNRVVSVDIGSDSLKVAIGAKSSSGLELIACECIKSSGVEFGVVTDIPKFSQVLKQLFSKVKVQSSDFIVVALSSHFVESTESKQFKFIKDGAKISLEDTDALFEKAENAYLKEELELLDVCLQSYSVDSVTDIQNPVGMSATRLEGNYTIFSCRKNFLANFREAFAVAGYRIGRFTFSPPTILDVLLTKEDREMETLFLDLGSDCTRATVFHEGEVRASFALPFGGRSLSLDIKNSYPVSLEQSEQLKKHFSCVLAKNANQEDEVIFTSLDSQERSLRVVELATVLQCRFDEIFTGIRYQLKKLALDDDLEKIIFLGAGATHSFMKEYLEEKFKIPTAKAVLQEGIFNNLDTEDLDSVKYASVLGVLYLELSHLVVENKVKPSIFKSLKGTISKFWGGTSVGENTEM